ncbi:TIGR02466 family protein [Pleionea sp. CnH1-48]|uniref:TIGR02466 family protein n=1 Tax=Pleionea sp. CnH1-48 TaxID=2954494 RepID=UPI002096A580|nr:TIGR02466 family protein [Pleionea sp. CnH1-48]MCO7225024.1 2OG-Fe(II) oxygenase family protein [Pleionea sp. CnH1-48]
MKTLDHFSVPLTTFRWEQAEQLNPKLAKLFIECSNDESRYKNETMRSTQNNGVFESKFDLFYWNEPSVQQLFQFCHKALASVVVQYNGYSAEQLNKIEFFYHSWFHVTKTGGFQGNHNHPMASWSGIYCIKTGTDADTEAFSGKVRFHDPRMGADMYQDPSNENLQGKFGLGGVEYGHKNGQLVIFPSYLRHEVFAHMGKEERIVVAFNSWSRWRS